MPDHRQTPTAGRDNDAAGFQKAAPAPEAGQRRRAMGIGEISGTLETTNSAQIEAMPMVSSSTLTGPRRQDGRGRRANAEEDSERDS